MVRTVPPWNTQSGAGPGGDVGSVVCTVVVVGGTAVDVVVMGVASVAGESPPQAATIVNMTSPTVAMRDVRMVPPLLGHSDCNRRETEEGRWISGSPPPTYDGEPASRSDTGERLIRPLALRAGDPGEAG
jgi:hypothetical protein